jgi:transposase
VLLLLPMLSAYVRLQMFRIDNSFAGMKPEGRKEKRLELLAPKMRAFHTWCIECREKAVPRMALHKALNYAIGQWPALMNALDDGRLPIENNRAERAIRPFAVGRRNWLFSDTPKGASASATVYSIVTTAKASGLNPRAYPEWLFDGLPNIEHLGDESVLERFLPWSDDIPLSCRADSSADHSTEPDPLDKPIIDIDPHALDEQ